MNKANKYLLIPLGLLSMTALSGVLLISSSVNADNDSIVDEINITVPVSCTLSGSGMTSHTASIPNGTYNSSIGETTIKAFCNDNEGFAIYAIGYTDEEDGKNVLTSSALGSTSDITTSTATSGNNSAWAMKLAVPQSPAPTYPMAIASDTEGSFSSFHAVPDDYTLVAKRTSSTDIGQNAEGSSLNTTYQAYISQTQPAGTYTGKVKYTMVHPNDASAPITNSATLDTGQTVNSKLKSLANMAEMESITINVHMETEAPTGFVPSEANTVSTPTSEKPIYITFDNTDDGGTIHFYTEGHQIFLSSDSSYMFHKLYSITDLSAISSWNTSNVTNMSHMFDDASTDIYSDFYLDLSSWDTSNVTDMESMFAGVGYSAATFSLDLSSWVTSNVTDMGNMFNSTGSNATTWTIDGLSSWDTSSVTDMNNMFSYAGQSDPSFVLNLSDWNTSNVINMSSMFEGAGQHASTWSIGDLSSWNTSNVTNMEKMFDGAGSVSATTFILDLSSWDTSNVTNMGYMFFYAGYNATTWSVTIPKTNNGTATGPIPNTTSNLYGNSTSVTATLPSGRSFTLAN